MLLNEDIANIDKHAKGTIMGYDWFCRLKHAYLEEGGKNKNYIKECIENIDMHMKDSVDLYNRKWIESDQD
jgi:hypothetical protein